MIRWWRRLLAREDPLVCRAFVELVSDYFEGTLPELQRLRLEAHLTECDGCRGYLEDMRRMIATLGELPPPPADPHTREALLEAFRELRPGG